MCLMVWRVVLLGRSQKTASRKCEGLSLLSPVRFLTKICITASGSTLDDRDEIEEKLLDRITEVVVSVVASAVASVVVGRRRLMRWTGGGTARYGVVARRWYVDGLEAVEEVGSGGLCRS